MKRILSAHEQTKAGCEDAMGKDGDTATIQISDLDDWKNSNSLLTWDLRKMQAEGIYGISLWIMGPIFRQTQGGVTGLAWTRVMMGGPLGETERFRKHWTDEACVTWKEW